MSEPSDPERSNALHTQAMESVDAGDDGWIKVTGSTLRQPILVRLAILGGRPRVVALRIDNGEEINSETLRSITFGEVISHLLSDWTPKGPDLRGVKFKYHEESWWNWFEWMDYFEDQGDVDTELAPPARQGVAPSDASLRSFAEDYLTALASRPHGAISRVAKERFIARSTAYRWRQLCQERGFLPQEDQ